MHYFTQTWSEVAGTQWGCQLHKSLFLVLGPGKGWCCQLPTVPGASDRDAWHLCLTRKQEDATGEGEESQSQRHLGGGTVNTSLHFRGKEAGPRT